MWHYSLGGQRYGPVDDAALDDLVRQGIVRDDTLIWREGMSSWQPHATLRGPRPAIPAAASQPPPAWAPPAASLPQAPTGVVFDYALWPTRALGALVDYLFVILAMVVLYILGFVVFGSLIGLGAGTSSDAISGLGSMACCCMALLMPVSMLLVGVYNKVYLVSTRGFSIGQGVVKVKVVDAQGNRLTQGTAFVRLLVQAGLGLVPIGSLLDLLWPLWDERRQTLHDKAVNCYVVNNPTGM